MPRGIVFVMGKWKTWKAETGTEIRKRSSDAHIYYWGEPKRA